jgi:hypothetical protein
MSSPDARLNSERGPKVSAHYKYRGQNRIMDVQLTSLLGLKKTSLCWQNLENSKKKADLREGSKVSPHATRGALWCQNFGEKWSPCSPSVARGSNVEYKRREKDSGWFSFPFIL